MSTDVQLKEKIIEVLQLEDMTPEELENDMPLFGDEGLGLDSVDAIQLVTMLDTEFNVKINNMNENTEAFTSVNTLLEFVNANQ